jgi:hypothetical protein
VSPTHFEAGTLDVISTRRHTLDDMTEGRVCASCNNGWMSQMESAAKPLLLALFHGRRDVADLDFRERQLVARWTAKTAYMLNSASNYCLKVPVQHLQFIRAHRHRLPERTMVVGLQHRNSDPFHWCQLPMWGMTAANDEHVDAEVAVMARQGYKICLQFAQLILMVCYLPIPGWRYVLWREIHWPIWPIMGPVGWSEFPHDFPWDASAAAVYAFAQTLEIMSPARTARAMADKRRWLRGEPEEPFGEVVEEESQYHCCEALERSQSTAETSSGDDVAADLRSRRRV